MVKCSFLLSSSGSNPVLTGTAPAAVPPGSVPAGAAAGVSIPLPALEAWATDWLFDCEYRQHTRATLANRHFILLHKIHRARDCGLVATHLLCDFLLSVTGEPHVEEVN